MQHRCPGAATVGSRQLRVCSGGGQAGSLSQGWPDAEREHAAGTEAGQLGSALVPVPFWKWNALRGEEAVPSRQAEVGVRNAQQRMGVGNFKAVQRQGVEGAKLVELVLVSMRLRGEWVRGAETGARLAVATAVVHGTGLPHS